MPTNFEYVGGYRTAPAYFADVLDERMQGRFKVQVFASCHCKPGEFVYRVLIQAECGTWRKVSMMSRADEARFPKRAAALGHAMVLEQTAIAGGVSIDYPERVHLKDIFGTTYIPKEAAATIQKAVEAMQKCGDIGKLNKWQFLEFLSAEYLSGHAE